MDLNLFDDIGRVFSEAGEKLWNIFRGAVSRAVMFWEAGLCLLGYRDQKYVRLKVFILEWPDGRPVCDENVVNGWLRDAIKIFEEQANVKITTVDFDEPWTERLRGAPSYAFTPQGSPAGLGSFLSDEDLWFASRRLSGGNNPLGWGDPITAFIVHDVRGKYGYALPGSSYFVVGEDGSRTTLAHELGHVLSLPHYKPLKVPFGLRPPNPLAREANHNLMDPGTKPIDKVWLSDSQICMLRGSRHVTFEKHGSAKKPQDTVPASASRPVYAQDQWAWLLFS